MKNIIIIYIVLVFSLICTVFLGQDVIPLFNNGIYVQYQRSTGPEFIVLDGEEVLVKMVKSDNDLINYSEVYVKNNTILDTNYGFIQGSYRITFDYIGVSKGEMGIYPIVNVNNIASIPVYYIKGILFIITIFFIVSNAYKLFKLSEP